MTAEGYGRSADERAVQCDDGQHLERRHRLGDDSGQQSASQQLGTLEIATFANTGLRPLGGNLFEATTASGEEDRRGEGPARGTLAQGFVEDSGKWST